jgi:nucleoside-diphosphate-sugar epimerase
MSLCSIVTGNSNTGSACIEELFTRKDYSGNVKVRGVFRSEEKAEPFAKKYPELEIVVGVDASKPETLSKAFAGAEKALIVTVCDYNRSMAEDANLTKSMISAAVEAGVKYVVLVTSWTHKDPVRLAGLYARY